MESGVYKFTNIVSNRLYIGSSIDISTRYNYHISGRGSKVLKDSILKYGINNFKFEIVELISNLNFISKNEFRDYIFKREQLFLDQYYAQEFINSNGKDKRFRELTYNLNPTAKGGSKWSDKSIERLKKKFKEKGHTCIGRIYTEETKLKMSSVHKERGVSVGINNPNYGKKQTLEKTNNTRDTWIKTGRRRLFNAIKEDIIYGPYRSSTECSLELGIWKCQIKKCLSNKPKYKSAKGYTFKYI